MGKISWILVVIGALNWGIVGVGGFFGGNWNIINFLLGSWSYIEWIVYILVGLAGLGMLFGGCKCKKCNMGSMKDDTSSGPEM